MVFFLEVLPICSAERACLYLLIQNQSKIEAEQIKRGIVRGYHVYKSTLEVIRLPTERKQMSWTRYAAIHMHKRITHVHNTHNSQSLLQPCGMSPHLHVLVKR